MSLYDLTLNTPKPWLNAYVNQVTCQTGSCGGGGVVTGSFTRQVYPNSGCSGSGFVDITFNYIIQNNIVTLISGGFLAIATGGCNFGSVTYGISIPDAIAPSYKNSQITIPIAVYGGGNTIPLPSPGSVTIFFGGGHNSILITKTLSTGGGSDGSWGSSDVYAGWVGFTVSYNIAPLPIVTITI